MWKVYLPLFSLLLIAWFVVLCIVKSDLMKTNQGEGYTINYSNNISSNNNNTFNRKGQGDRKIKQHIPRFMLELYENGVKDRCCKQNGSLPDIVRSVIPKNAVIMEYEQKYKDYKDNHLLIFDVPETNVDEDFISAELKILSIVDVEADSLDGLQKIVKISIYDDEEQKIVPLQETNTIYMNNTWLSFNLTKPVQEILSRKDKFLKLVISIKAYLPYFKDNLAKFRLSLLPIVEDFEHDYPVLLLTYSTNKNETNVETRGIKRRQRSTIEEDYVWEGTSKRSRKSKNICRRKSLYVDFSEIQYDSWIVQPSGYEAYQCQGRCFYPVAEHLSPTKHAIIQALLHSVDPSKAPKSCCVPTKLSSISVLYIDDKGILTYRYAYKDMVVVECGCR